MYYIVVGALSKGAVDVAEGHQSVLGHTTRECGCMSLGNTHIEHPVGHFLHHYVHRASCGHGWRNAHDVGVALCQFQQRLAEHLLVFQRIRLALVDTLARVGVELARRVPYGGMLLGRLVALALNGVQMQQLWSAHVLKLFKYAHHLAHIVAVERSEVAYVHALKNVLLMSQRRLQGVVQPYYSLASVVVQVALRAQPLRGTVAQPIVRGIGVEVQQILLHTSHGTVYAHIVVVQHDKQVVGRRRHVVQSLEGQSARHGSIAYHSHHMSVGVSRLASRHSHAQSRRDGVGRVSARKGVVGALLRRGERPYAMQLAIGVKVVLAARQYLVAVGLMAHIPHYAVVGGVEHVVQGNRQFHHAQRRSEMTWIFGQFLNNVAAQLGAQPGQLSHVQTTQVAWILYVV